MAWALTLLFDKLAGVEAAHAVQILRDLSFILEKKSSSNRKLAYSAYTGSGIFLIFLTFLLPFLVFPSPFCFKRHRVSSGRATPHGKRNPARSRFPSLLLGAPREKNQSCLVIIPIAFPSYFVPIFFPFPDYVNDVKRVTYAKAWDTNVRQRDKSGKGNESFFTRSENQRSKNIAPPSPPLLSPRALNRI